MTTVPLLPNKSYAGCHKGIAMQFRHARSDSGLERMRSWHTIYRTWYRSPPTILSCQGSAEQAAGPVPRSDPEHNEVVLLDAGFISSAEMRSKSKTRAYKMLPDFAGSITSVSSYAVFKAML